jgi:hypothetical protein
MGYGTFFGLCFGEDMTAITVENQEWTILAAVDAALTGATVSGVAVFKEVTVTTSAEQARDCQYKGQAPRAVVRYVGTEEKHTIEGEYLGVLSLELRLSTRIARGVDESAAVQEGLRLVNAAKNAVQAAPPNIAYPVGTDGEFAYQIEWGSPSIDTAGGDSDSPWITAVLSVKFGMDFNTGTSH